MDLKNEKLEVECPNCRKKIVLTFNTTSCPKCGINYESEAVHKVFYDYESNLANSKNYQFADKAGKAADSVVKAGSCIEQLGCIIFLLPLALFCLYMLFKIFSG